MIFSSIEYLLFLPVAVFLYWRTQGVARLCLVVLASYFFYMSWLPVYGILLVALTTTNWLLSLALAGAREKRKLLAKALLGLGLFLNLGCLCYYKYANFFISNLLDGCNWLSLHAVGATSASHLSWTAINVMLPLGISFFVFEFVHYLVDVYRGDKPLKSWLEFAAFAAFFPSQIAGPIKRYQDFIQWLRRPLPWSKDLLFEAGALIVQGLFKKVALADPLGIIVAPVFAGHGYVSAGDACLAALGFWIQVYCDFSGYTDIGRGSALLMGIRLPENFNLPYLSEDLGQFWRRWHMTLGLWLRDYVYIPLGGSRRSKIANWRSLFLTMLACGLWHGAAWHYVVFGCLQGAGLIVHREWRNLSKSSRALSAFAKTSLAGLSGTATTAAFIILSFTIFRAPDVPRGIEIIASLANGNASSSLVEPAMKSGALVMLVVYAGFWLTAEAVKCARYQPVSLAREAGKTRVPLAVPALPVRFVFPAPVRLASWTAAVFLMIAAHPSAATPFVYFQF